MQRRGFLSALAAAIAAPLIDPERLLWVPGKKLISIPSLIREPQITSNWITTESLRILKSKLTLASSFHSQGYDRFFDARPTFGPDRDRRPELGPITYIDHLDELEMLEDWDLDG